MGVGLEVGVGVSVGVSVGVGVVVGVSGLVAVCQRGLTEEMPENVHFCIQKAATHSHFIRSTPF